MKLVPEGETAVVAAPFARAPLPTPQNAQWRSLSLFCGGGGLDLGFLGEGVGPEAAYDNSKPAVRAYGQNLGASARFADLATYTPNQPCEILLAGAPCQGFSTAGRRSLLDPRNALLRRVADVTLEVRPRVVVVENVLGALSGSHRNLWTALEDRIRLAGYNVARLELRGEESGVAQRRRRLFLLGWLGSGCVRMELPHLEQPGLRATLAALEAATGHNPKLLANEDPRRVIAEAIPQGGKLCNVRQSARAIATWDIPRVFGETTVEERELLIMVSKLRRRARKRNFGDGDPVELGVLAAETGRDVSFEVESLVERGFLRILDGDVELKHTYNGKYRRLAWDEMSPTVDTRFGQPGLFLHPDQHRGLTVREAARIQGFPDAYRLPSTIKDSYEIVGNAVPPPMAARLAGFVREALLKSV